ncbi:serine hydrolase domain-containing protein [Acidisphaera rubrifaciens]|uniref:Penicillin-binding protein n=1 Tax=Acidisphaera rubrifaciens HS-AP3 TaxID=1231350 RepID=A0A0D6P509_9PROT|nr:serine hydrolase domain-containing protein [Acidisphaera rubrifaciens]GAN76278.1 penicillin-binding protein [Acidisphaera rubrifaciens HS-AP3]
MVLRLTATRRALLAGATATGMLSAPFVARAADAADDDDADRLFADLDTRIITGMQEFAIPGAAVGVFYRGRQYLRGYGVTSADGGTPVDPDTRFRIASTSKTFTGASVMRLVEAGRVSLERRVDHYIDGFVAPPGAQSVTVRMVLNHSAGWLGYDYHDTGSDDGALARYVDDVRKLPQLTPVGTIYAYNNAALSVSGRIVESVTGATYESAVGQFLLQPLGLSRSLFSETLPAGGNIALPHDYVDGKSVPAPDNFYLPRSNNPFGGIISTARDQLAYMRFLLRHGRADDGRRVLSPATLHTMWSNPGPGGTLFVELIGWGVSWMLRPTAEGITVVQHGGDLPGYHSGFMMVPERRFGITLLTNSDSGPDLLARLFIDDWALRRFARVRNLPAVPQTLGAGELAPYEGAYTAEQIGFTGPPATLKLQMRAKDGALTMDRVGSGAPLIMLKFYKRDYVVDEDNGLRANFLRDPDGSVAWFRLGGRLFRHVG